MASQRASLRRWVCWVLGWRGGRGGACRCGAHGEGKAVARRDFNLITWRQRGGAACVPDFTVHMHAAFAVLPRVYGADIAHKSRVAAHHLTTMGTHDRG